MEKATLETDTRTAYDVEQDKLRRAEEEKNGLPYGMFGFGADGATIGPTTTMEAVPGTEDEFIVPRPPAPRPFGTPVNFTSGAVDGLQTISNPSAAPVAQTAEEVVQGAPLPPGIEMAFRNALVGAPQTAQDSIPLLSPQVLNSLTPAEQQVYFGLAQMQGQYLPDFENLLASRGGSQQVQDSQRVFA